MIKKNISGIREKVEQMWLYLKDKRVSSTDLSSETNKKDSPLFAGIFSTNIENIYISAKEFLEKWRSWTFYWGIHFIYTHWYYFLNENFYSRVAFKSF